MKQPPGAAADREALKWELAELEYLLTMAPHSPWCFWRRWHVLRRPDLRDRCNCWRGAALRIIRYSPEHGDYQWPQTPRPMAATPSPATRPSFPPAPSSSPSP